MKGSAIAVDELIHIGFTEYDLDGETIYLNDNVIMNNESYVMTTRDCIDFFITSDYRDLSNRDHLLTRKFLFHMGLKITGANIWHIRQYCTDPLKATLRSIHFISEN